MNINLARKWRSKQFDEIVGQPLAVRLVKNSLYRNLVFPVYLMSGTRGTGKTSTARLFAAALNCSQLEAFQKDPKNHQLPCLSCESCTAMQQMNHPDFIEIDAASHTGVDNVRQIIDAASFVPVLGTKKIYLIDEAHMLSKAAFNAFLKILEEPPKTVVFMLATTDPHKILPTVTSRCFQIFFDPIKPAQVVEHLRYICEQEGLKAEPEALMLMAQETEGSMRDALNLLERLRALPEVMKKDNEEAVISKQAVLNLLGSIDEARLCEVLYAVVTDDAQELFSAWSRLEISRYNPSLFWKKLVETLRRALWLKQGIAPDEVPVPKELEKVIEAVSYERLISLLDLCYSYELSFSKTAVPTTLLEVLLLKMTHPENEGQRPLVPSRPAPPKASKSSPPVKVIPKAPLKAPASGPKKTVAEVPKKVAAPKKVVSAPLPTNIAEEKKPAQDVQPAKKPRKEIPKKASGGPWGDCLAELSKLSDPLVISIFTQAIEHTHTDKALELKFSQDLAFFKDWLGNTKALWQPIIEKVFGEGTQVVPQFDGPPTKQRPVVKTVIKPATPPAAQAANSQPVKKSQAGGQMRSSRPQRRATTPKSQQEPAGKPVAAQEVQLLSTGAMVAEVFPGKMSARDLPQEST